MVCILMCNLFTWHVTCGVTAFECVMLPSEYAQLIVAVLHMLILVYCIVVDERHSAHEALSTSLPWYSTVHSHNA